MLLCGKLVPNELMLDIVCVCVCVCEREREREVAAEQRMT